MPSSCLASNAQLSVATEHLKHRPLLCAARLVCGEELQMRDTLMPCRTSEQRTVASCSGLRRLRRGHSRQKTSAAQISNWHLKTY